MHKSISLKSVTNNVSRVRSLDRWRGGKVLWDDMGLNVIVLNKMGWVTCEVRCDPPRHSVSIVGRDSLTGIVSKVEESSQQVTLTGHDLAALDNTVSSPVPSRLIDRNEMLLSLHVKDDMT